MSITDEIVEIGAQALGEQLAAERRRREETLALAERQDATHMEARKALAARAEQAERERDEARDSLAHAESEVGHLRLCVAEEMAARERAEADNAELMRALHRAHGWTSANGLRSVAEDMVKPLARPHPGAAMLERMTHLEEKVEEFARYANEAHAALDEAGLSAGGLTVAARLRNMLERMRALEVVRDCGHMLRARRGLRADVEEEAWDALRISIAKADTLKPETK